MIKKSVRVHSNDPENPLAILHVEATVKSEHRIEDFSLNLGNVRSNERIIRNAFIEIGSTRNIQIADITTSSEFISAREIEPADPKARHDSVQIEITIEPGLKSGLLSEKVMVNFKDDLKPAAHFYLYGIVVDDIEVAPLRLNYIVTDSILDIPNLTRKLKVVNFREDLPLEIIDVNTPGDNLEFEISTLKEGKEFEIKAVATEKILAVDSVMESRISITTNNPDMRIIKVPFRVVKK